MTEAMVYSEEETKERASFIGQIGHSILLNANAMPHAIDKSTRLEMRRGTAGDLTCQIIFSNNGVVVERLTYRILRDGSIQKEGFLGHQEINVYYSDKTFGKGQHNGLVKPPLNVETNELRDLAEFVKDPTHTIGTLHKLRRLPRSSAPELTGVRRTL